MVLGKNPLVSIAIVNWNGKHLLEKCLSSIFKLTRYDNFKVAVFDNGSSDGSVEYIENNFPQVDIKRVPRNLGVTKGLNGVTLFSIEKHDPDYIFHLNNDTEIIEKDWLTKLVEFAESDKKIGIVGCKLLYPDGSIQHAGVDRNKLLHIGKDEDKKRYTEVYDTPVTLAAALVRRECFDKVGLFDEIYSPYNYEDIDFCLRSERAGYRVVYFGKSTLVHYENKTISNVFSLKKFYVNRRNKITFFRRFYSTGRVFKEIGIIIKECLVQRGKLNKDFPIRLPVAVLAISGSFLRSLRKALRLPM